MNLLYWIIASLFVLASFHIFVFSLIQLHLLYLSRQKVATIQHRLNDGNLPFITIQLPIYNEQYVVKKLIEKIVVLAYPRDKFEIQILDDSTDETSAIIQSTLQAYVDSDLQISYIRRTNRKGYKAGALAEATLEAKGDLIAIFDADFRPETDFLLKTVPYFQNKKVGALQTRWGHLNEEQSVLTKLQSILLNNHFIVEQNGRFRGGLFLQFNGTAGIWRKSAIEAAGGWLPDTLTEDLDLSYRAQMAGWRIVFLNDVVCPAEIPATLKALKVQQFRWMQGGAESARKHLRNVWSSSASKLQKIHGTMHLLSSYVFISILLTAVLSVPMIFAVKHLEISPAFFGVFSLGMLFNGLVFFVANYYTGWLHLSKRRRIFRFITLFPLLIIYCMGLAFHNSVAIYKGFMGIHTPFNRTPKYDTTTSITQRRPSQYKPRPVAFIAWMELLLGIYFMLGIGIAFYTDNYSFLSYNVLLVIAYTLVIIQSANFGFLTRIKVTLKQA